MLLSRGWIEEAGEIKSVFADISIKDDKWGRIPVYP
jgi:hypothetical protein